MSVVRIIDSAARHATAFNVWEVIDSAGVNLRTTPNTAPPTNNVIHIMAVGTLVERLDNTSYPDTAGTGSMFFRVRLSAEPGITGFAAAQMTDPTNPTGVQHFLAKTVSAREAQTILRLDARLQETCDPEDLVEELVIDCRDSSSQSESASAESCRCDKKKNKKKKHAYRGESLSRGLY
jgi:hypothetical protein